MTTINYSEAGLADIQTDSFTQVELFAGDTPPVVTDYGILGGTLNGTGLAAWTPVFVDPATRAITVALYGTQAPNAISVAAIPAGAGVASNVPVYKAGMFNRDALAWPASYDTAAKKANAFVLGGGNQIYTKTPAVV